MVPSGACCAGGGVVRDARALTALHARARVSRCLEPKNVLHGRKIVQNVELLQKKVLSCAYCAALDPARLIFAQPYVGCGATGPQVGEARAGFILRGADVSPRSRRAQRSSIHQLRLLTLLRHLMRRGALKAAVRRHGSPGTSRVVAIKTTMGAFGAIQLRAFLPREDSGDRNHLAWMALDCPRRSEPWHGPLARRVPLESMTCSSNCTRVKPLPRTPHRRMCRSVPSVFARDGQRQRARRRAEAALTPSSCPSAASALRRKGLIVRGFSLGAPSASPTLARIVTGLETGAGLPACGPCRIRRSSLSQVAWKPASAGPEAPRPSRGRSAHLGGR